MHGVWHMSHKIKQECHAYMGGCKYDVPHKKFLVLKRVNSSNICRNILKPWKLGYKVDNIPHGLWQHNNQYHKARSAIATTHIMCFSFNWCVCVHLSIIHICIYMYVCVSIYIYIYINQPHNLKSTFSTFYILL